MVKRLCILQIILKNNIIKDIDKLYQFIESFKQCTHRKHELFPITGYKPPIVWDCTTTL